MSNDEMALAFYKAASKQTGDGPWPLPPYVPARVLLPHAVRGDWMYASTVAPAGEHGCTTNRYGAVSVEATDGKLLGIKPHEMEVLEWKPNPHAEATA